MKPKQKTAKELRATAYHEAGHATAAFMFEIRIERVTIVSDDACLGHCLSHMPKSFNPELNLSALNKLRLENRVVGLFVGQLAEKRFTGRANYVGARHDRRDAIDLASYVHGDNELLSVYLRYLHKCAEVFVHNAQHWAAIVQLAKALVARRTLTGKEAVAEILAGMDRHFQATRQKRRTAPQTHAAGQ